MPAADAFLRFGRPANWPLPHALPPVPSWDPPVEALRALEVTLTTFQRALIEHGTVLVEFVTRLGEAGTCQVTLVRVVTTGGGEDGFGWRDAHSMQFERSCADLDAEIAAAAKRITGG